MDNVYFAIDLKSFYASVECSDRGLNPLTTHLVVADASRTEKTICLAVSPSLKSYGIPGRERLYVIHQKVNEINRIRKKRISNHSFTGYSFDEEELKNNLNLELAFITATPRMARYIEVSTKIYQIYLRYVAPEDIHVYSIDEVFIDATQYLSIYKMTKFEFARKLILEIYKETKITATAGIGTNLFLCKVAMDIVAKHQKPDSFGVRIADLDVAKYRQLLWDHKPLTDFWRVGRGYAAKLASIGLHTMGDIALCSIQHEDTLFRLFGVYAELLIDHAWGYETATMEDIKHYKPASNCISSGQVLPHPYSFDQALIVMKEMVDTLSLELVEKKLVTNMLYLVVSYDSTNLTDTHIQYDGEITTNFFGKNVPKHAKGSIKLDFYTSSTRVLLNKMNTLFIEIVKKNLLIRRLTLIACNVVSENDIPTSNGYAQMNLFKDPDVEQENQEKQAQLLLKEKKGQETILKIKKKYGKNAILKGMDLEEGATGKDRNKQIGGHKA